MNREQNKAALLGAILAATVAEQEKESFMKFENPYAGLEGLTYSSGNGQRSFKKAKLSNKQKKRRAANKKAKKARKRNR
jgi:hypothetical protein